MNIEKTQAMTRRQNGKKGFTLTEIAIVLGIIGLILGAIWVAAANVYANQRTAHANTAILQIAQGTRALFSTSTTTGTAGGAEITQSLINAGAVPTDLVKPGAAASPFTIGPFPNGATYVFSDTDQLGFTIVVSNVPNTSCVNLISTIGGQNRDAGLFLATGGDNAAMPAVGPATGNPMAAAVGVPAASLLCPTQGGAGNYIEFGFTLK